VPPMVARKTIQTSDERAKGIESGVLWDGRVCSSIRIGCFMEEICNNVFTSNGLIACPPLVSHPTRSPVSRTPLPLGQRCGSSHRCDRGPLSQTLVSALNHPSRWGDHEELNGRVQDRLSRPGLDEPTSQKPSV